jgi:hypothetical protein
MEIAELEQLKIVNIAPPSSTKSSKVPKVNLPIHVKTPETNGTRRGSG